MNNQMTGKFAYSHDEERYYGTFDTFDEAKAEALDGHETAWVGECRSPDVLGCVDGECLIDHILSQDEFGVEWAEGSIDASKEQMRDLDDMLRESFKVWLDKHNLWPTFFNIENAQKVCRES